MKELAEALERLEQVAGDKFWTIAKGKTHLDERMFGVAVWPAIVTEEYIEPMVMVEGDNLIETINAAARALAHPEVTVRRPM
jgi:hypothetical protein